MRWPEKSYLFDRERRFVYCPIPKVAMTSIKLWVLAVSGDRTDPDDAERTLGARLSVRSSFRTLRRREAASILRDPTYFRFAFVRNPWSRLVSAYLNKFLPAVRQARPIIREVQSAEPGAGAFPRARLETLFARALASVGAGVGARLRGVDYERGITFRQFASYVAARDPVRLNRHWRPQHLFLADHRFDSIGRFETLDRDFDSIRGRLGVSVDLPHRNSTGHARVEVDGCVADWTPDRLRELRGVPDYRRFYTADLIDLVARVYAGDIARFGYAFE